MPTRMVAAFLVVLGVIQAAAAEPPVLRTVDEAIAYIAQVDPNKDVELYFGDELFYEEPDASVTGVKMAIVINEVFKRGLLPGSGYVQKEGYRIYTFVPRSKWKPPAESK